MSMETTPSLPDVARETDRETYAPLEWVGMTDIEIPVLVNGADGVFRQAARATAQVSLDLAPSRGIHMSRLYLRLQEGLSKNALSLPALRELAAEFLKSHEGLSRSARVSVTLEWPLLRRALKSANSAWRTYPVTLSVENRQGRVVSSIETIITYSSTCPASAALSRQLIQENFERSFAGRALDFDELRAWLGTTQGIVATPHAQRSHARVRVDVTDDVAPAALVDLVEDALQTAVQGAVKREDEQEFALRNGQNLMFCEDAARRVKAVLDADPRFIGYEGEFSHVESLHPHNAVATIRK